MYKITVRVASVDHDLGWTEDAAQFEVKVEDDRFINAIDLTMIAKELVPACLQAQKDRVEGEKEKILSFLRGETDEVFNHTIEEAAKKFYISLGYANKIASELGIVQCGFCNKWVFESREGDTEFVCLECRKEGL